MSSEGEDSVSGNEEPHDRANGAVNPSAVMSSSSEEIRADNGKEEKKGALKSTYRDYSRSLPEEREQMGRNPKEPTQTFPMKLHSILSNPEFQDIIAWLPHGRAWRILQHKAFEERVIPLYFRHGRYSSFARQVNGWGFRRITHGPDYNAYYHEMFLRGMPHLCEKMKRLTAKDAKEAQADDSPIPDFYALSRDYPLPDHTATTAPPPPPPLTTSGHSALPLSNGPLANLASLPGFMQQQQSQMSGFQGSGLPPDLGLNQSVGSGAPSSQGVDLNMLEQYRTGLLQRMSSLLNQGQGGNANLAALLGTAGLNQNAASLLGINAGSMPAPAPSVASQDNKFGSSSPALQSLSSNGGSFDISQLLAQAQQRQNLQMNSQSLSAPAAPMGAPSAPLVGFDLASLLRQHQQSQVSSAPVNANPAPQAPLGFDLSALLAQQQQLLQQQQQQQQQHYHRQPSSPAPAHQSAPAPSIPAPVTSFAQNPYSQLFAGNGNNMGNSNGGGASNVNALLQQLLGNANRSNSAPAPPPPSVQPSQQMFQGVDIQQLLRNNPNLLAALGSLGNRPPGT